MSDFDFTEAIEAGAAGKRSMQRVDRALTEMGVPQDVPTLDQRLYGEPLMTIEQERDLLDDRAASIVAELHQIEREQVGLDLDVLEDGFDAEFTYEDFQVRLANLSGRRVRALTALSHAIQSIHCLLVYRPDLDKWLPGNAAQQPTEA